MNQPLYVKAIFLLTVPAVLIMFLTDNLGGKGDDKDKGPDICDCVNMDYDDADDELRKACEELGKEYADADDETQRELMEKIEECYDRDYDDYDIEEEEYDYDEEEYDYEEPPAPAYDDKYDYGDY